MPKLKTIKSLGELNDFNDYAIIINVLNDNIEIDYYDFPWKVVCEKYFATNYRFAAISLFNCYMNHDSIENELKSYVNYLMYNLAKNHHEFNFDDVIDSEKMSWTEIAGNVKKRINQNCDKVYKDWIVHCDSIQDAINSGKRCYYQKSGKTSYFNNYLDMFIDIKYNKHPDSKFLIILADDDVQQFTGNLKGDVFNDVDHSIKDKLLVKFNDFLKSNDFLY